MVTNECVFLWCSEGEPPTKKPKTTSVVVEQAGQSDKVVIDHVPDTDSVFEEVHFGGGGLWMREGML